MTIARLAGAGEPPLPPSSDRFGGKDFRQPFELSQGRGVPVCETYVKMHQAGPPIRASAECVGGATEFEGIAAFDLRAEYGQMTDEVVDQVVDLLWERDANPAWYFGTDAYASWTGSPEQLRDSKQIFRAQMLRRDVRFPRLDLNNDGSAELILYMAESICSDNVAMPIVITGNGQAIDQTKTALLARHPVRGPRWRESRVLEPDERIGSDVRVVALPDAFESTQYVFFSFAGETYFALTWYPEIEHALDGVSTWQQAVFLAKHDQVKQVCAVDFHRSRDEN